MFHHCHVGETGCIATASPGLRVEADGGRPVLDRGEVPADDVDVSRTERVDRGEPGGRHLDPVVPDPGVADLAAEPARPGRPVVLDPKRRRPRAQPLEDHIVIERGRLQERELRDRPPGSGPQRARGRGRDDRPGAVADQVQTAGRQAADRRSAVISNAKK